MTTPRIPILVNRSAGASSGMLETLRTEFGDAAQIAVIEPGAMRDAVAAAVAAREPIIGVAGGDGTLHTVVGPLIDTETALLCIPTGTLNHFARRHGVADIAAAAEALRAGRVRSVAVGTLQDSWFLNTLTFGEYSRMLRLRERFRPYLGKWPAAVVASMAILATLQRMTVTLTVDGTELARRTPIVWIGVGRGTFPRVHEAPEQHTRPDLEVTMPRSSTKAGAAALLARLAREMLKGEAPLRDRELEVLHARGLNLVSGRGRPSRRPAVGRRIDATSDGELLRVTEPVRVGVKDAALRVVVGPDAVNERVTADND